MTSLLLLSLLSANSFPPCSNGYDINKVWKAQDGTFWWCSGSSWTPIVGAIDGGSGVFDSVTVNGPLTARDAGFTNLSVGSNLSDGGTTGTETFYGPMSAADAGFNNVTTAAVKVGTQLVPTQHSATQLAIESGSDAGTAGTLTVAFGTAFSVAPACFCSHVRTTNDNTCTISTTIPTTALAQFMVDAGATDIIDWFCVGAK